MASPDIDDIKASPDIDIMASPDIDIMASSEEITLLRKFSFERLLYQGTSPSSPSCKANNRQTRVPNR